MTAQKNFNPNRRKWIQWAFIPFILAFIKKYTSIGFLFAPQREKNQDAPKFMEHGQDFQRVFDFRSLSVFLLGVPATELDESLVAQVKCEIDRDSSLSHQLVALLQELKIRQGQGATLEAPDQLSPAGQSTAKKLLYIWYTGEIETHTHPKRIFYDDSPMYRFYRSIRPAPGSCFGALGYWSAPPITTQGEDLRKSIL